MFNKYLAMKLSVELQAKLRKQYEPDSLIEIKFKGLDVVFRTDFEGNANLLFIGKKKEDGKIKGARYVRTLQKSGTGTIIKDHWDFKGKST
jgi:hypothetical protein